MKDDLALRWARRLVSSFADAGVREVVVSPGLRSTPLVLAALADERLRVHVVLDERSAAFFALGISRATTVPAVFVCTSGTAGAHAFPAVIEASQAGHPLVVVTADRPMELRDCAAPQTIDQIRLFGDHVRHFVELGAPDPTPGALDALARIGAQCILRARWPRPGAVHLNAAFRKPLEPADDAWRSAGPGPTAPLFLPPVHAPSPEAVDLVARAVATSERGVIAVGALPVDTDRAAITELAARAGLPLLAETTSQLRRADSGAPACPGFDALLRSPEFRRSHEPDLVVEIGLPLLSPGWASWMAEARCRRIAVAPHGPSDPHGGLSAMVLADPAGLARAVTARLGAPRGSAAWRDAFLAADRIVWDEVRRELAGRDRLVDGAVAAAVLDRLPEGSILQLGASLPLRDVDVFSRGPRARVSVLHPRGANGIDGLVASAAGAQAATGRPTALLCGDVSLLHDVGSLVVAARARGPLVIVVVNNDGGRIFEELPLAEAVDPAIVARAWTTPHGLSFASAAAFAGIAHSRVTAPSELARALEAAWAHPGASLVEAVVPGDEGTSCRKRIRAAVRERMRSSS